MSKACQSVIPSVSADRHQPERAKIADVPHASGKLMKQAANPIELYGSGVDTFSHPPRVGEHSEAVLQGLLGYDSQQMDQLRGAGVVQCHQSQRFTVERTPRSAGL